MRGVVQGVGDMEMKDMLQGVHCVLGEAHK